MRGTDELHSLLQAAGRGSCRGRHRVGRGGRPRPRCRVGTKSADVAARARAECRDLLTDRGLQGHQGKRSPQPRRRQPDPRRPDRRAQRRRARHHLRLRSRHAQGGVGSGQRLRRLDEGRGQGTLGMPRPAAEPRLQRHQGRRSAQPPEGNTILVSLIGDRKGDQRDLTCVYDPDSARPGSPEVTRPTRRKSTRRPAPNAATCWPTVASRTSRKATCGAATKAIGSWST